MQFAVNILFSIYNSSFLPRVSFYPAKGYMIIRMPGAIAFVINKMKKEVKYLFRCSLNFY